MKSDMSVSLRCYKDRYNRNLVACFVEILQIKGIVPDLIDCSAVKRLSPTLNSMANTIGPIKSTASIRRPMRGIVNSRNKLPSRP